MSYTKNTIEINGQKISYWRIENTLNGNPRYVIHYLDIADNFDDALRISREVGGKKYRAKWFGGGIVISSYNLQDDLERIIK